MSYEIERIEHEGLVVRIVNDEEPEEPDWGGDDWYLSCNSNHHRFGRAGETTPETHLQWGEGPWGEYGDEIPKPPPPGDESEAYNLYEEWQADYDDTYVAWPFTCGNAHGPGSFCISLMDLESLTRRDSDGWIYVKRIQSPLERIAYPDRDEEKIRDRLVKLYEQWANGDVWGFIVEDGDGNELDSCWGFYGSDAAVEAGKESADNLAPKGRTVKFLVLYDGATWDEEAVLIPLIVPDSKAASWALAEGVFEPKNGCAPWGAVINDRVARLMPNQGARSESGTHR